MDAQRPRLGRTITYRDGEQRFTLQWQESGHFCVSNMEWQTLYSEGLIHCSAYAFSTHTILIIWWLRSAVQLPTSFIPKSIILNLLWVSRARMPTGLSAPSKCTLINSTRSAWMFDWIICASLSHMCVRASGINVPNNGGVCCSSADLMSTVSFSI